MKSTVLPTKLLINLVIVIILSGLIIYFIIIPRSKILQQNYATQNENQKKIAELESKKESLAKLEKEKTRIENAAQIAANLIPQKEESSNFLSQINIAASITGNIIKSINLTAAKQEPKKEESEETTNKNTNSNTNTNQNTSPYNNKTFSLDFSGNFSQLTDFLATSENFSRFNIINSLTISSSTEGGLESKVEGEIYFRK